MAGKNIPVTQQAGGLPTREETRTPEKFIRPAVDILESEEGLTLLADIPGVEKDGLNIHIDKGILTIEGRTSYGLRGNTLYREFELADYYRQFQLPEEIDPVKVAAELKNGVLTLNLPKAEAAKPRRIEITTH